MIRYPAPSFGREEMKREDVDARYDICSGIVEDNISLIESETFSVRLHRCLASFRNVDTLEIAHYSTAFLLDSRQDKFRFLGCRHLREKIDFELNPTCLLYLRKYAIGRVNSLVLSKLFQTLEGCNLKIKKLHTCNAAKLLPRSILNKNNTILSCLLWTSLRICMYV